MDTILHTLEKYIKKTEKNKSSYWKEELNNKNYKNIYTNLGFGAFNEIKILKSIMHFILSRVTYENYIFKTKTFIKIKNLFTKINRQIDNDSIRHIFTFNLIKNNKFKNSCVIGDGKANFLTQYITLFPNKKIYSVNLAETLINDYLILKKTGMLNNKLIKVVENENDLKKNYQIFLIPANNKNFLKKIKIDLFVNIDSFQEMNMREVKKYFSIIKLQKSLLYCCNREYKKLPNGEEIIFKNFPWGRKLKFQECPWEKNYYTLYYPYINKYPSKILHTLINFKNGEQII